MKRTLSQLLIISSLGFFVTVPSSADKTKFWSKKTNQFQTIDFEAQIDRIIKSKQSPFVTEKLAKKHLHYKDLERWSVE